MAAGKDSAAADVGVVMTAVDKNNWITTCRNVVRLKACTAMAAESTSVSVLIELVDLLFATKFNWKNVNECINQIFRK